jgi:hypothetical protein
MKVHRMSSARSGILSQASEVITEHVWPLTILSVLCSGVAAIALWAAHPTGFFAIITWFCLGYFGALAVALPLRELAESGRIRRRLLHLTPSERLVMDGFAFGKVRQFRTNPLDQCVAGLIADGLVREIRTVSPSGQGSSEFVLTTRAAKQKERANTFPPLNGPS